MLSDACFAYLHGGDIPALIRECLHYAEAPFAYGDEPAALLAAAREAERDPGKRPALDGLARLVMDVHDSPPDPRTEEMRRAADLLRRELAAAASAALGRPVRFEADAAGEGAPSANHCGACNRCCKTLFVADEERRWFKPRGVWCEHTRRGKGCTIYGAHPTACREYQCFWLASQNGRGGERGVLPGVLRPDRCGAVLEENAHGEMVVWMDAERSDAIDRGALAKFVDREVEAGRVVVARRQRRRGEGHRARRGRASLRRAVPEARPQHAEHAGRPAAPRGGLRGARDAERRTHGQPARPRRTEPDAQVFALAREVFGCGQELVWPPRATPSAIPASVWRLAGWRGW
jgi:hypothetical protein